MQIPLVLEIRDKAQDKLNTDVGIIFSQTVSEEKVFQMQNRKIEKRAAKSRRVGNGKLFGECANCASLGFSLQAHMRRKSAGHGVTPISSTTFDS